MVVLVILIIPSVVEMEGVLLLMVRSAALTVATALTILLFAAAPGIALPQTDLCAVKNR